MQFCVMTPVVGSEPLISIKNETTTTAVFIDYWVLAKMHFFIFAETFW